MNMIKILIETGKEKFLTHPLIEMFMKMKWRKTWFLFWIYLILYGAFFFVLAGYSVVHYGAIKEGYKLGYGDNRSGWW